MIYWNEKNRKLIFPDGSYFQYQKGKFDNWQVNYVNGVQKNYLTEGALRDVDYLRDVKKLRNEKDGLFRRDFNWIFEQVTSSAIQNVGNPMVNQLVIDKIRIRAAKYKNLVPSYYSSTVWEQWHAVKTMSVLYLAMISEWHYVLKGGTRSKYRHLLKKLAIYQVLSGISPEVAAEATKGVKPGCMSSMFTKYKVKKHPVVDIEIVPGKEQYPI